MKICCLLFVPDCTSRRTSVQFQCIVQPADAFASNLYYAIGANLFNRRTDSPRRIVKILANFLFNYHRTFREQIYLETDEELRPGIPYAVRLKFQYKLSDHLEGFYLSRYKDKHGKERLTTDNVNTRKLDHQTIYILSFLQVTRDISL